MKICGIYKIQSTLYENRIYIGSSTNVNHRKNTHFSDLRRNAHASGFLQNHYNKYGGNDLFFEIIEFCNVDNLIEREQYYIDTIKPCFNIRPIANSNFGLVTSEETKRKLSIIQKKLCENPEWRKRKSEIAKLCFNPKGLVHTAEKREKAASKMRKIIIDISTGVFFFGSKEAAKAYNLNFGTLHGYLENRRPNKTNLIYA